MSSRLLLVGATGAVGREVLAQALADSRVGEVVALTRRPLAAAAKLTHVVVDFEHLPEDAPWWAVDAVICTLGTTLRAAGSQAGFVAVDRDLPLRIAQRARAAGATRFALNSSLGADAASKNFYLRTKGEAEDAIAGLGYPGYTIVRPALIDTERVERRPAEALSLALLRPLRRLIPGRWRPVRPEDIARALLDGALDPLPQRRVIESAALQGVRRAPARH